MANSQIKVINTIQSGDSKHKIEGHFNPTWKNGAKAYTDLYPKPTDINVKNLIRELHTFYGKVCIESAKVSVTQYLEKELSKTHANGQSETQILQQHVLTNLVDSTSEGFFHQFRNLISPTVRAAGSGAPTEGKIPS